MRSASNLFGLLNPWIHTYVSQLEHQLRVMSFHVQCIKSRHLRTLSYTEMNYKNMLKLLHVP